MVAAKDLPSHESALEPHQPQHQPTWGTKRLRSSGGVIKFSRNVDSPLPDQQAAKKQDLQEEVAAAPRSTAPSIIASDVYHPPTVPHGSSSSPAQAPSDPVLTGDNSAAVLTSASDEAPRSPESAARADAAELLMALCQATSESIGKARVVSVDGPEQISTSLPHVGKKLHEQQLETQQRRSTDPHAVIQTETPRETRRSGSKSRRNSGGSSGTRGTSARSKPSTPRAGLSTTTPSGGPFYRFGPGQPVPPSSGVDGGANGTVNGSSNGNGTANANGRQKSCAYVGVRRRQWGTYAAEIRNQVTGAREWLGTFESPEEAAVVYDARLRQIKGANAKCNFPPLEINGETVQREICPHGKSAPQRLTLHIPADWMTQVAKLQASMVSDPLQLVKNDNGAAAPVQSRPTVAAAAAALPVAPSLSDVHTVGQHVQGIAPQGAASSRQQQQQQRAQPAPLTAPASNGFTGAVVAAAFGMDRSKVENPGLEIAALDVRVRKQDATSEADGHSNSEAAIEASTAAAAVTANANLGLR